MIVLDGFFENWNTVLAAKLMAKGYSVSTRPNTLTHMVKLPDNTHLGQSMPDFIIHIDGDCSRDYEKPSIDRYRAVAAKLGIPSVYLVNSTIINMDVFIDPVLEQLEKIISHKQDVYRKLLYDAGGNSIGNIVSRMGVRVMADHNGLTCEADLLMESFGISSQENSFSRLSEFAAKLTYLSFKSSNMHDKLQEMGHLSCYGINTPAVLVVGHSLETQLEMVSHSQEFNVPRLTSSMAKAMSCPMYSLTGPDYTESKIQKVQEINRLVQSLKSNNKKSLEFDNMLQPGLKASAMLLSAAPKDWHKLFLGRIKPKGIERQTVELCMRLRDALEPLYPEVIQTEDYYLNANNAEKYKS